MDKPRANSVAPSSVMSFQLSSKWDKLWFCIKHLQHTRNCSICKMQLNPACAAMCLCRQYLYSHWLTWWLEHACSHLPESKWYPIEKSFMEPSGGTSMIHALVFLSRIWNLLKACKLKLPYSNWKHTYRWQIHVVFRFVRKMQVMFAFMNISAWYIPAQCTGSLVS